MENNTYLNTTAAKKRKFDAIVIGSGISGGWAAKELCEKGLKTLVLERGGKMDHITDYKTAFTDPWKFPHRNSPTFADKEANPIQSKCYAWNEGTQHLFIKDEEHPYTQVKPFDWIRGYQVGGKSLMWARQCYRLSAMDFEANAKEGVGIEWPISYEDIAPWYSYVERFAGINGNKDGLPQLPDGEFQPAMEMNCLEKEMKSRLEQRFPNRKMIMGRSANHTLPLHGRGPCLYRNLCHRGCPVSGYFSSNSATIPAAQATKKLTLKPDSVVHSIIFDEKKQKATGVRVIDANTKEMSEYYAKIIFVNAATLNSTLILLNSTSSRFPNGLGNDSDALGRYLMAHNYRVRFGGLVEGYEDKYYTGRRPNSPYIPRFRNIGNDRTDKFLRGYAFGFSASRQGWERGNSIDGFGAEFKEEISKPGPWTVGMHAMGEMLPDASNRVSLNHDLKDQWGMPTLKIDCEWKANENAMSQDILEIGKEIMEAMGVQNISANDNHQAPGLDIHEMGTARMGNDPKTSVLNAFNQVHGCPNVFVTDGASMTSSACQNPSLTYMALTARACDYAVQELKRRNL
ncbi:MAG: GMC family oxidoreductase [Saprospiraceae bacterium]|nr:GMC family oxidoreductase [Saprospiraceae bacterium]